MAVEGINPNVGAPNFAGEEKKKGSIAFPVTLGLAGGLTGYLMGQPIKAKQVLEKDKFELSKNAAKDATDAEKTVVTKINTALSNTKGDVIKTAAENNVKNILGEKTDLTVEEYLKTTTEKYEASIKEAEGKTEGLTKNVTEAEKGMKEAEGKTAEVKKAAEDALNKAKTDLDIHNTKIEADKAKLEFAKEAKGGKITKDALLTKETNALKGEAEKTIAKELEALGKKAPKVNSGKNALIYGGIALVAGFILKAIFGGKKEKAEA